jgi:hypothetical protein
MVGFVVEATATAYDGEPHDWADASLNIEILDG